MPIADPIPPRELPAVSSELEDDDVLSLAQLLEDQAIALQDEGYRDRVNTLDGPFSNLWEWVDESWTYLAHHFYPSDERSRPLLLALARFSRNIVAGNPSSQDIMAQSEPSMRKILYALSSYQHLSDESLQPLIRALSQALCNLLTGNEILTKELLPAYVRNPFDSNLIIRLLASEDIKLTFPVVVLLRNGLDVFPDGARLLTSNEDSSSGLAISEAILRRTDVWFEKEEDSQESIAFEVGYDIFRHVFRTPEVSELYERFTHPSSSEPISAAQLTLLKLFDAHIQSSATDISLIPNSSISFLIPALCRLMAFLIATMQTLMDGGDGSVRGSPFSDLRFEKVYGALVLVLQSVLRLGLAEGGRISEDKGERLTGSAAESGPFVTSLKLAAGAVEDAVVLLRLADVLEPRLIRSSPITEVPLSDQDGPKNFAYLRRDLVRVIGMLSYEDRTVQDRVRTCGGLELILSLCGMDENNPYLREHALFTIRCLLLDNVANQTFVKELRPIGTVDENGTLGDLPERWKKAA